jgi:hypothetical protein
MPEVRPWRALQPLYGRHWLVAPAGPLSPGLAAALLPQVLKYMDGQKYDAHWDWFDDPVHHSAYLREGNRLATVLMYLAGGQQRCWAAEAAAALAAAPAAATKTWHM